MLNISKIFKSMLGQVDFMTLSPIEKTFVKNIPIHGANVVMASLISLSLIKTALTKKTKNSLENKFYLGAKVREKRYSNRYDKYQKRLDFVYLHNKIFTSSYNVFLYTNMNKSSDLLYVAMSDIYTYEAFEKGKK